MYFDYKHIVKITQNITLCWLQYCISIDTGQIKIIKGRKQLSEN